MISFSRAGLALLTLTVFLPTIGWSAEPAILAKARARLGADAALDGMKTIRYSGTLTTVNQKDGKPITAKVEMVFQKPDMQRITATYDTFVETTALNSYEGWTRVQDGTDASKWRLTLLDAEQVKRLRANTFQSLAYFRGLEKLGVQIKDEGVVTKEGVSCQKITFTHGPRIVFHRYFEIATGRLVLTETETGAMMREEGEMSAAGIRFPKTLITVTNAGDKPQTITIVYDKVVVNESLPSDTFAVPAISRR